MSDAPDMSPGIISWNELATSDAAGSKEFYAKLFGWQIQAVPGMDGYEMIMEGERMVAGCLDKSGHCEGPALWFSYVTVEDVEASLAKAIELGAEEVKGITEIPGKGTFAIVKDPQGAVVGLWQFAAGAEGDCG